MLRAKVSTDSSEKVPSLETNDSTESEQELKFDSLKFGIAFALILTAIQRVIGLARGILFCRVLPEEQLGQWSLAWSYLMLLAPIAVLGLPGSFCRFVEHYRQKGQLKPFLIRVFVLSGLLTAGLSLSLYFFASTYSSWFFGNPNEQSLVIMMAIVLGSVALHNFLASLVESLRQVRLVTVMRFIAGVSFAAIALGLVMVIPNGTWAITLGFGISCLVGSIPAFWFLARNWNLIFEERQTLPSRSMWSRIAPFAAWIWVINLVSNLYEMADRSMLIHLANATNQEAQAFVGQYHSGRVIPLVLVGLSAMLGGILMPYLTAHWEQGRWQQASRQLRWALKLISVGFTGMGIIVILFAPLLFDGVLQGKYNDGLAVLPLTLVYCIWISLLTVGQDYLWCSEKGKWACLAVAAGLVVNVVLNFALIPGFGLYGAVWSTAISNLLALMLLYAVNHKFGWQLDIGIWVTCFLPLVLLASPSIAFLTFAILCFAGIRYHWILDREEIAELKSNLDSLLKRIPFKRAHVH